jgi:hypothetical protein
VKKMPTSWRSISNNLIMFLKLKRFIEMMRDLELSFRPIAFNKFSRHEDKCDDLQNDTLDDDLHLLPSQSSWISHNLTAFLWTVECRFFVNLGRWWWIYNFRNFWATGRDTFFDWRSSCLLAWPSCCFLYILVDLFSP